MQQIYMKPPAHWPIVYSYQHDNLMHTSSHPDLQTSVWIFTWVKDLQLGKDNHQSWVSDSSKMHACLAFHLSNVKSATHSSPSPDILARILALKSPVMNVAPLFWFSGFLIQLLVECAFCLWGCLCGGGVCDNEVYVYRAFQDYCHNSVIYVLHVAHIVP